MIMNEIKIIDATADDAEMIAYAIMEAVGDEIVNEMAGNNTRQMVREVFTRLARRDDSQYSYRNSRVAVMPSGIKAGVCISYDGARLKPLRRAFFEEANRVLGWNMTADEIEALPGETCGEEFYLDTIATLPQYRKQGVATALIADARKKAEAAGLPLGLLVADDNPQARELYESIGFSPAGRRPFAGTMMTNLRIATK